jgi:hypothetical protein
MPKIIADPAPLTLPTVSMSWDDAGSSLACAVSYVETQESIAENSVLSRQLDRQFNIRTPVYILTGGTFSMALDAQMRIKDWDIYSNPEQWIDCALPSIDAPLCTLKFSADFDLNHRASIMGDPTIRFDRARGAVDLFWSAAATWHGVGETLAFGETAEGVLAQIRLEGLHIKR